MRTLQHPAAAIRYARQRGKRGRSGVEQQLDKFLAENPKLREAMEIVKVSNEQYARALSALSTPVVYTAAGSNEGAGVLHVDLESDPG